MRCARIGDIAFVQSVLNAPSNLEKLAAYADAQLVAALEDASQRLWIWEDQGVPAAFLWVTGIGGSGRGPKIEEFGATSPGRGIGTRLFSAVLHELQSQQLHSQLWLAVAADNKPAIRFYERFGFKATELRPGVWRRRVGPVADALLMEFDPIARPVAQGGFKTEVQHR